MNVPSDPFAENLLPDPPRPPDGIELAPGVRVPSNDLRLQYSRGSGPGGQNVNKVNTRAELWVPINRLTGLSPGAIARLAKLAGSRLTLAGEIHISSDVHRTQEGNRSELFDRLRQLLLEAMHEPKRRRKTKPSRASKRRRLESKRHRSETKSNRRVEE